ncbi:glyoxylate/hydroxypyruvate reductase HPR3-like [Diospyros lotus]|uniref:glyoxylate/hydroxypyruvate reductase HPR3-like n=1 Tax=Diospyros lotus TaxID=55363 RepID=UPI002258E1F9|nr:glyoxylate/hydroxypyruvate reductase HPR3-like [Diospyros lotus]
MANPGEVQSEPATEQLPTVLILHPPSCLKFFDNHFSLKFQALKPWESPLPIHQFLAAHGGSVRAVLTSGLSPVGADVLSLLPSVRCLVTSSAGLDHIDLPECRRRGVAVAGTGDVYSADVADMAVGLLIDVMRRITASDRYVRGRLWPLNGDYPLGSKLSGKHVGIVGLGRIGLEVARRLQAFGCTISYCSRKKKQSLPFPFYSNVCELAAECEILVVCCALTDQTRRMISKEALSALGKKGVVVNIARGAVVDEKELVRCLVQGEIAGAGLDVFEKEPEVPSELFALDNVVLSPHGAMHTEESFRECFELICGNFEAFFSNKPLLSQIMDD